MKRKEGNTMRLSIMALALGATLLAGNAWAAKWDGGDDLPTNPLPCDGGAGTMASKAYDGGKAVNPPDKAGKPITLVDVPKLIGIGYFNATSKGMQDAAKELGNVKVTTDGPTEAKIDEQVKFIDNYMTRGVDGILFAANDPVAIAPVLKKALGKGIHVVGYDANSTPDAREWFVNQAQFNGIAKAMIDNLAKEIGEDKSFGIVTSTFTTPNQARWIAEMSAYAAKCHPKLKWLETVEANEDNILSFNQASALLNKYGDQMSGLLGMTSVATPASAEAVSQAKLCGKVAIVGLATPNAMKPYVKTGCVKSVVLWNPVDLGYAAVYVMRAVVDGKLKPGDTSVEAGKLGKLSVVNGSEILLGAPFVYSKDNIDSFNF
jgi:ABC-type sugar transport system substrate-binding protein